MTPIDDQALSALQGLLKTRFNIVLEKYIEESDSMLEQLQPAKETHDEELMIRIVHSLKSSSRNLGANDLSDLSGQLEESFKNGQYDDFEQNTQQLKSMYNEVKTYLTSNYLH
ncbi:Hpt domain-containing protein [Marinicellulosiphila megalodicopiae]|uniref:Hpt domain-containing protein n=1 Tax=Marinicellulosiphila megalodicopiae TaxID=2724896 RepID=UPI003BB185E8